jgi:hypothetical protein
MLVPLGTSEQCSEADTWISEELNMFWLYLTTKMAVL